MDKLSTKKLPTYDSRIIIPNITFQEYFEKEEIYKHPIIMIGGREYLENGEIYPLSLEDVDNGDYSLEEIIGCEDIISPARYGIISIICNDIYINDENDYNVSLMNGGYLGEEWIKRRGILFYHEQCLEHNIQLFGIIAPNVVVDLNNLNVKIISNE